MCGKWSLAIFAMWSASHGLQRTTAASGMGGGGSMPVTTMIGILLVPELFRNSLTIVSPSTDGSIRSSRIKSGARSSMAFNAAKPSAARTHPMPRIVRAVQ